MQGYLSSQDTSARLLQLSNARGAIVHLDEVLTMSAMMAAVTGEVAWIERYKKFELGLTAAIETALAVARSRAVALAIDEIDVANTELVKMEYQSFEFVLNGRPEEARAILTASTKQAISLLVLDLDHFKQINDTYGHDVGDVVLKTVATRWNAALRNVDTLARVGGDEFTAILAETNIEQAKRTAERLHAATKGSPIDTSAGAVAVTVSIGISAVEAGENDARAALRRTDRALY